MFVSDAAAVRLSSRAVTPRLQCRRAGASAPPCRPASRQRAVVAAAGSPGNKTEEEQKARPADAAKPSETGAPDASAASFDLQSVNPLKLGRKSRQFVDDVWQRVLDLGNVVRKTDSSIDNVIVGGPLCDFEAPQASYTTVLVVGATGRVGRILVRKLLLRGYTVRALVRDSAESLDGIPSSVTVVRGDVGQYEKVKEAMEGVNKVVVCMRARSTFAFDVANVERDGIRNITKALLDINNQRAQRRAGRSAKSKVPLIKFKREGSMDNWDVDDLSVRQAGGMSEIINRLGVKPSTSWGVTDQGHLGFDGTVFLKGDAQLSGPLNCLPKDINLADREGVTLRARGDGKRYGMVLRTTSGDGQEQWYISTFVARPAWSALRLPFTSFRPLDPLGPPLDAAAVTRMGFRYESRGQPKRTGEGPDDNAFELEVGFVKALPGGDEPDVIMVSCAGAGIAAEDQEKVVPLKKLGEEILKNSGLGYTIVRPGQLYEEPGGAKALVFDQGGRINQGISCADVADVCLKSLHDVAARNKSFDVCYEYTPEEGSMYELVAHLPDKSNNYLTPALMTLEKNT